MPMFNTQTPEAQAAKKASDDSLDLTGCVAWLSTDCPEGAEVYVATDDGLQCTPLVREEPVVALGM
jgi:hypothetical protein